MSTKGTATAVVMAPISAVRRLVECTGTRSFANPGGVYHPRPLTCNDRHTGAEPTGTDRAKGRGRAHLANKSLPQQTHRNQRLQSGTELPNARPVRQPVTRPGRRSP